MIGHVSIKVDGLRIDVVSNEQALELIHVHALIQLSIHGIFVLATAAFDLGILTNRGIEARRLREYIETVDLIRDLLEFFRSR